MTDYKGIARQYGINDDKVAKRLFSRALDITRKLVGDVPQNTLEREFPKELSDNFQDVLQRYTDQNYKGKTRESVRKVKEMSNMTYDELSNLLIDGQKVGGYKIKDYGDTWILLKNGRNVGEDRQFDNLVIDVANALNIKENNIMKNKTRIREYVDGNMPLDDLIANYDLEEEESYSQSMINPNTTSFKGRKKEYADDDGSLAGENGYGTSYAPEGENAYGTRDDKNEILDMETAYDEQDDLEGEE